MLVFHIVIITSFGCQSFDYICSDEVLSALETVFLRNLSVFGVKFWIRLSENKLRIIKSGKILSNFCDHHFLLSLSE